MPAVADIVSSIPGAQQAITYVAGKLREFDAAGKQLTDARHRAAVVAAEALRQGRSQQRQEALDQMQRLTTLIEQHDETADRVAPVTEWLRDNGFGVIVLPVVIAVAAVAAASSIAYVIAQTAVETKKLALLEKGVLTPEQLVELEKSQEDDKSSLVNIDLGAVLPLALAGLALYWVMTNRGRGGQVWS